MSRRSNRNRRVTKDRLYDELADFDEHAKENMRRLIAGYHHQNVQPLVDWASLPWWKRLFSSPPAP